MAPFRRLGGRERALLRPAPLLSHVEPMKAVLTDERFSDPGWIYERKLDGIRCIAIKGGGEVRLLSRNALSLDARFPAIRDALAADPADAEMVVGGWTAPRGSRTDLGALLIGVYGGGVLRYAGKVGTGFTRATLRDLAARLAPL